MQGNFTKKIKNRLIFWRVGILPGFVIIGFMIIARLMGLLQFLEWSALDKLLRLRPSEPIDERIVIVGINETDIRNVGTYPIPDRKMAELLIKLQSYQPAIIGLDIFRDLPVKEGYSEIVAAFNDIEKLVAIEKILPEPVDPPPSLPPEKVGFADAILDTDGRLRRYFLGHPTSTGYKFSFPLKLAQTYLQSKGIALENGIDDRHAMRFDTTELPRFQPNSGGYVGADAGGVQLLLNYRSGEKRFRILSLNEIETGKVNPLWLRDRIIIIGVTASSAKDVNSTYAIVSNKPAPGLVYGVEIQAHAVSQIVSAVLDRRPLLQVWADGWEYFWIIIWGCLGIAFSRLTSSPLKNISAVVLTGTALVGISYLHLILGWWIPVVPAFLVFVINGLSLTAFYQYDSALRTRISDRQSIIDTTFDTIHNGPLQTLAKLLKTVKEEDLPRNKLLSELEKLDGELRAIYEFMQQQTLNQDGILHLASNVKLDLQVPLHEILYQVYSYTLERDLPCFKTLKLKIRTFDPIDDKSLSILQKRGISRFLEEALCNVGKHAQGVTRIVVSYTQKDGWYILSVTDNGKGRIDRKSEGRGTQQSENLARQLKGNFERVPLSPKGTLCKLTWPVKKRLIW